MVYNWWSKGLASKGKKSHHRHIQLCRAIAPSISDRLRFFFRNAVYDLESRPWKREGVGAKAGGAACIVVAWSRTNYCSTLKLILLERNNIFKYFFHFMIAFWVIYNEVNLLFWDNIPMSSPGQKKPLQGFPIFLCFFGVHLCQKIFPMSHHHLFKIFLPVSSLFEVNELWRHTKPFYAGHFHFWHLSQK